MRRIAWMVGLAALLLAGGARGQSTTADESASDERQSERRQIRVLADPYDISSFYRSSDGSGHGYGYFSYDRDGRSQAAERYPIAGYYRNSGRQSFGYWRAQTWRRAPLLTRRTRRAIDTARHNDLYLFVPALLVPVLPLAEEPGEPATR
jgi:hypothetical protein